MRPSAVLDGQAPVMVQCAEVPEQAPLTAVERPEVAALREPPNRVSRRFRTGTPLDWSAVDRCRLLILITVPFFAAYGLRSGYLLTHPDVEPYFDRGTLASMRLGLAAACFFWALFLVWGSLERRRPGPHTLYLVVGSLSWWLGVVGVAYALGPITTPAWIAVVIGCVTSLLLLPKRVAILGISVGLTLLLTSLVCAMAGMIPYGPALSDSPIVASQMPLPYAIGNTLSSLLATVVVVVVIAYVVTRWHDALDRLRHTNADLDRVVEDRTSELARRTQAEDALRESEDRYRRLTDNAFDLIMEVDSKGRLLYVSPNHRDVLGFEPDDLIGRISFDLLHPDDRQKVIVAFQMLLVSGWNHQVLARVQHRDGGWRWFESSGNAYPAPRGEMRAVVISRDVTERREAQMQREKLEAQMQQTQKLESLGVLAGGIAHDFNNLLAPILGNARLLESELPPDSPVRPFAEQIATAALRTSELTTQLLTYAGRGTLTTRTLDVRELVREMGELLHMAVSRKVDLRYELPDALPPVEGDPAQLRQVVLNLIMNASEAIGDEPGVVTIGAGTIEVDRACSRETYIGRELPAGSYIYLDVRDDGCGMDEETRSKIFDPFFTTKFTGRGLGLAALLGIVRAHRGAVAVESEPGRGTRFRLLFPRASGSVATSEATTACPRDWRGSGTVLVVDDDEAVRELLGHLLPKSGLSVIMANDGKKAVERFREHASEIAAVLLDLTMPEMGGVEAFIEMRRIRPDARIILSSGYSVVDVAAHLEGQGVDGFLQKPYEPRALIQRLRELLEE
jgi:PAS domain S-box-containing protein